MSRIDSGGVFKSIKKAAFEQDLIAYVGEHKK